MSYDCSCDYEPVSVSRSTFVKKARRRHTCDECGCEVAPGEGYENAFYVFAGDANTHKTCKLCVELRQWATISVPCFCWGYGNLHQDVRHMVDAVRLDVPGFIMEWGRRMVPIRRRIAERYKRQFAELGIGAHA